MGAGHHAYGREKLQPALLRRGGDVRLMKSATTATVMSKDIPGAVAFPPWLSKTVVGCFLLASFTATWGGIYLGGFQVADIFLFLTFIVTVAMVVFGNLRFAIPWWLWAPAVALFVCFTALIYSPIPDAYFGLRYEHALYSPFRGGSWHRPTGQASSRRSGLSLCWSCRSQPSHVPRWTRGCPSGSWLGSWPVWPFPA